MYSSTDLEPMLSAKKNIAVNAEICSQTPCTESCGPTVCHLCVPCLSHDDLYDLQMAYREHMRIGDNKRIFPVTNGHAESLSPKNQMMTRWYEARCKLDMSWC